MNKVVLKGKVVRDPVSYPVGDTIKNIFTVLVEEDFVKKDGEKSTIKNWIKVEAWGKLAEYVSGNIVDGNIVSIDGSIKTESYMKGEQKVYQTLVNAKKVTKENNVDLPI